MSETPAIYRVAGTYTADYYGDPADLGLVADPAPYPDVPASAVGGHSVEMLAKDGVTAIRCRTCHTPTRILTVEPFVSPRWSAAIRAFLTQHPMFGP